MTTTQMNLSPEVAKAILTGLGDRARYSSFRFIASNGVNYTHEAYDLPDGSHLESGTISPTYSTERHVWILWNPAGTIINRFAPTPRGFFSGRPSDLDTETWGRFQRAVAFAEEQGGWSLKRDVEEAYKDRWAPITPEQIEKNREDAACRRSGRPVPER